MWEGKRGRGEEKGSTICVQCQSLLLTIFATLGKVFQLTLPPFLPLQNKDNKNSSFLELPRRLNSYYKVLGTMAATQ